MALPDIQGLPDTRGITIDAVGIAGLRYPLTFDDGELVQGGIGEVEVTVGLPAHRRGTHMSRMVQAVEEAMQRIDPVEFPALLKYLAGKLEVDVVGLQVALPIATRIGAPTTRETAWQVHDLALRGAISDTGSVEVRLTVRADVTSVCPCSKAISDYGAHNQRSQVMVRVTGTADDPYPMSATTLIDLIRSVGSCPVYPVIKRPDERTVTMTGYDNPKFVEDIARDLSRAIRSRGLPHSVRVRNLESIHSHDAVAEIEWRSQGSDGTRRVAERSDG